MYFIEDGFLVIKEYNQYIWKVGYFAWHIAALEELELFSVHRGKCETRQRKLSTDNAEPCIISRVKW